MNKDTRRKNEIVINNLKLARNAYVSIAITFIIVGIIALICMGIFIDKNVAIWVGCLLGGLFFIAFGSMIAYLSFNEHKKLIKYRKSIAY